MTIARVELMDRLRKEVADGKIILGTSPGTGITVKIIKNSGIDLIFVYNTEKFNNQFEGLLPYGDANGIVIEMGNEILPIVGNLPIIAGVCGTDPFRLMGNHLRLLKEQGYSGVQNFPTVGLYDGLFRDHLEDIGMGYDLEVNMIHEAHKLGMFTCPFVFNRKDTKKMVLAGADCVVAHLGLFSPSMLHDKTKVLHDCVEKLQQIVDEATSIKPDILVLCHGGPLSESKDFRYVLSKTTGMNGLLFSLNNESVSIYDVVNKLVGRYKKMNHST